MTTYRGPTAKGVLDIEWEYPVYVPPQEESDGKTVSKQYRRAMSREEAVAYIAGDDPRPLLVLRECKVCNGTDDALLKTGMENEQTFLLAAWFHCVKVPVDVMEEDHPFHNLFVKKNTEHLFICSIDGSNHNALESTTSRTELWKSMRKLIGIEYRKKPSSALKQIAKLLDRMDRTDQRWNDLMARRDEILEEDGPKSRKLPKLEKDLREAQAERQELVKAVTKASKLELKERKKVPAEKTAPAGERAGS